MVSHIDLHKVTHTLRHTDTNKHSDEIDIQNKNCCWHRYIHKITHTQTKMYLHTNIETHIHKRRHTQTHKQKPKSRQNMYICTHT